MNKPGEDVEVFLSSQPEKVRNILEIIRATIKATVPDATELISYQMPAFKFHGIIAWYAPFKNHYSLFIRPVVMEAFKEELKPYKLSKSAIRFPFDHPVPVELITRIVRYSAELNLQKEQLKSEKKMKGNKK
jgi:uncharacterized protein YdhG (YjbR/CyaY superfamily)